MNKKNKIILSLIMFLNIGFVNAKNYDNDSLNFNPLGMVVNNSYLENESIIKSCSDFNINPIIEKKSESCGTGYNGSMQYERIKTAKISSGTKYECFNSISWSNWKKISDNCTVKPNNNPIESVKKFVQYNVTVIHSNNSRSYLAIPGYFDNYLSFTEINNLVKKESKSGDGLGANSNGSGNFLILNCRLVYLSNNGKIIKTENCEK